MRTAVTESSIRSYRSLPNSQKKSVANLIFSVIERSSSLASNGMSMAEIQRDMERLGAHIEKSTISARINEMVAAGRLFRASYMRRCSITGKSIHPVSLALGQLRLL
jgi:hypothetical protein